MINVFKNLISCNISTGFETNTTFAAYDAIDLLISKLRWSRAGFLVVEDSILELGPSGTLFSDSNSTLRAGSALHFKTFSSGVYASHTGPRRETYSENSSLEG